MQLRKRYLIIFALVFTLFLVRRQFYVIEDAKQIVNNKFLSYAKEKSIPSLLPTNIHKLVTLVIRFSGNQHVVNLLRESIHSFLTSFPQLRVLVITDQVIIPPTFYNLTYSSNVQTIVLNLDLLKVNLEQNPFSFINTKYVFIVPEGAFTTSISTIQKLVLMYEEVDRGFVAIPAAADNKCLELNTMLREWTLEYKETTEQTCDSVKGFHGLFTETKLLEHIKEPFTLPFPELLYIKSKLLGIKIIKVNEKLKMLPKTKRQVSKSLFVEQNQRIRMNMLLKIKKIVRENGLVEWYGCNRNTTRCFSDTVNSMPRYIYEGRWTPPCCLNVLREVTVHTIKVLEKYRVRYWLEGGSLLGAMRSGDIIPWDYDVDIGIYKDDVYKCPWLKKVDGLSYKGAETVVDDKGYVWEKSKPDEGDFYRVQASNTNHMHIDIFPFYPKNGIMTKDTWFSTHPQDKEFPEQYLKPLTTIDFVGIKVSAPNNIREFLEFKFGKNVIENPRYPDLRLVYNVSQNTTAS